MSFSEALPLVIGGAMVVGMFYMMFRAIFLSFRSAKADKQPEAESKKDNAK
jgi:hypothetical protein